MKSSGGEYFAGLDHVRGLAALLVVIWHFAHWTTGYPVPFNQSTALGILDEGHVGVAIFMVLSGYLFAKLIGENDVDYPAFFWNRAIRLLPLLIFTMTLSAVINDEGVLDFLEMLAAGIILPRLPNGGWSITVEMHFYALLPLILMRPRSSPWWPLAIAGTALAVRLGLWIGGLDVQSLSYLTIIGRIDQFLLGIVAFRLRRQISGRLAASALIAFWALYSGFDAIGGYYGSPFAWLWVGLPSLEGATIAMMIAWYDRSPIPKAWLLQKAGEYSYSIYLLHFFFVEHAARFVDTKVMRIDTLLLALPWAVLFFLGMMAIGAVSWKLIEHPPLRLRRPYLRSVRDEPVPA